MILDLIIQNFSKINKNGINTILIMAIIALFISFFSNFFGSILFFLVIFSLYFFRDPERITPNIENISNAIFAPADGIITSVSEIELPKKFAIESENLKEGEKMIKISIFLSVFDVHVNRIPVDGIIKKIIYSPGKFINASKEKESDDNENNTLFIRSNNDDMIIVTQISGLIARRIICEKKTDDIIKAGERFGIIKFGSRVNLYVPSHYKILVHKGQRMVSGETIMAIENLNTIENFINKIDIKK